MMASNLRLLRSRVDIVATSSRRQSASRVKTRKQKSSSEIKIYVPCEVLVRLVHGVVRCRACAARVASAKMPGLSGHISKIPGLLGVPCYFRCHCSSLSLILSFLFLSPSSFPLPCLEGHKPSSFAPEEVLLEALGLTRDELPRARALRERTLAAAPWEESGSDSDGELPQLIGTRSRPIHNDLFLVVPRICDSHLCE